MYSYLQATFSNVCRPSKIHCVPTHPPEPGSLPRPTFGLKLAGCITPRVGHCLSFSPVPCRSLEPRKPSQLKPY